MNVLFVGLISVKRENRWEEEIVGDFGGTELLGTGQTTCPGMSESFRLNCTLTGKFRVQARQLCCLGSPGLQVHFIS
jgi:hypothetical protein